MPTILEACQGRLPEQSFEAGEVIIAEGTPTGKLFILAAGTIEVAKQDIVINTLSDPGSVFGEISVLLDTVHTATVRTTSAARFFVVDDPLEFMRATPDVALGVARLLAHRLYAMTTYLVDLKHQFDQYTDHFGMVDQVLDALTHSQHEEHSPGSDREGEPNY
jgi:CRP-like cAMP-binding protein